MMNERLFLGGRQVGVGIANPAAENCIAKGGKLTTYTNPNGDQGGLCVFPDGTSCEEWAFFRGTCHPGEKRISPLLTYPAGGAVIGGLIGYAVKRNAKGVAVGAAIGAATPLALVAAIIGSGWAP